MSTEPRILDLQDSNISVSAKFDRKKIDQNKNYEGHIMVSLEAEDKDFERTPVNAALVLDVSSSMHGPTDSGETRIEAVKKVAVRLVENLTAQDEVSVITFASSVEVVVRNVSAENKAEIINAINAIDAYGNTNMSGGLLEGMRQINKAFEGVKRVMILTDGQANQGIHDSPGLLELIEKREDAKDCAISTFAFGTDADQELLADMAKKGVGNFYYIKGGSDIANVFARELGGMISCSAQNIKVTVKPNKGNEVLEVLNDFSVEEQGDNAIINAEDIYVGEKKHILIKLKVKKPGNKPKARPFSVAHVEVSFDDVKNKSRQSYDHNVKVKFVPKDEADDEAILEVEEQVALLEAAKGQLEAIEMATSGNFRGARSVIRRSRTRLVGAKRMGSSMAAKGLVSFNAMADDISEDKISADIASSYTAIAHGAMKMRATGGPVGSMSAMYSTSAQDDMVQSFMDGSGTPPVPAVPAVPAVPVPKVSKPKARKDEKFGKKRSRK